MQRYYKLKSSIREKDDKLRNLSEIALYLRPSVDAMKKLIEETNRENGNTLEDLMQEKSDFKDKKKKITRENDLRGIKNMLRRMFNNLHLPDGRSLQEIINKI